MMIKYDEFERDMKEFVEMYKDDGWCIRKSKKRDYNLDVFPLYSVTKKSFIVYHNFNKKLGSAYSVGGEQQIELDTDTQDEFQDEEEEFQDVEEDISEYVPSLNDCCEEERKGDGTLCEVEYHVVYDTIFHSPCLYFRVYFEPLSQGEGCHTKQQMNQEQLLYFLQHCTKYSIYSNEEHVLSECSTTESTTSYNSKTSPFPMPQQFNKYTFVTQGEHPHLLSGSIYFYIHPCETSSFMDMVLDSKQQQIPPKATPSVSKRFNYIVSWISFFGSMVSYHCDPKQFTQTT